MQGEVKMQGDMQVKVNVPLYKRQAKGTGKTTDFDQLLRGKNQQLTSKQETAKETPEATGAVKRQPKKDGETSEAKTDSTNAEETVEPEDTQQNALLQAAMQQTAALMAGIMPDIQETPIDQEEITSIEELAGMEEMVAAPETRNQETAVVDAKLQEASWQIDLRKNTSGDIQELSIDMQHEKPGQEADEASVEKVLEPLDTQMKGRQEKTEASQQQIVQEDMAKQQKVNVTEVLENKGQQDQTDFSNSPKPEEYVKPVRRQEPAAGNEKTSSTKSLQQRGEGQVVAESVHTLHSARQESFFSQRTESTVPLKTTPDTLPQDLGKTLAKNMMESGRTLTEAKEQAVALHAGENCISFRLSKAIYEFEDMVPVSGEKPEGRAKEVLNLMGLNPDGKSVTAFTFGGAMNPKAEWEKLLKGIKITASYEYRTADGSEKMMNGTGAMMSSD